MGGGRERAKQKRGAEAEDGDKRQRQVAGQTDRTDAVDNTEIDRLGVAPNDRVHAFDRYVEHLARRHGVDVEPIAECLDQVVYAGDMCQHAQLNLTVVERDQLVSRCGDEGLSDAAALPGAERAGLAVRVGLIHAAGLGAAHCRAL